MKKSPSTRGFFQQYGLRIVGIAIGIGVANVAMHQIHWTFSVEMLLSWTAILFIVYRLERANASKTRVTMDERIVASWHRTLTSLLMVLLFAFPTIFVVISIVTKHTMVPVTWVLGYVIFCGLVIAIGYQIMKRQ